MQSRHAPRPDILSVLSKRIREVRQTRGMTQEALSLSARIPTRHLQKLEAGSLNVTIGTLSRVADGLGVELWTLLLPANSTIGME
jgi:transcriptional regulator with XRE-family HTH domain